MSGFFGPSVLKRLFTKLLVKVRMCRRVLQDFIGLENYVNNAEVLSRLNKDAKVMFTIRRRKLEYIGHITRNEKYRWPHLIMQGKIAGKRSTSRRKNLMVHKISVNGLD